MNALTKQEASALPAFAMAEQELMAVLRTSLYPGAQDDSIRMALGYCKAAGLDPMQKPVHIVPMWDRNSKQMRDVIMPGIGLYRTQAARSGALAGISEPEFGPMINANLGGTTIDYPEWCRVTVSRSMQNGQVAQFTAREFWIENYATAGKDSAAPNTMWRKRSRGQIAKCTQAQALRMAFPEMTGSQPTAEEMEGAVPEGAIQITDQAPRHQIAAPLAERVDSYPQEQFDKNLPSWKAAVAAGKKTADQIIAMVQSKSPLTDEQKAIIRAMPGPVTDTGPKVTYAQVADAIAKAGDADKLNDAGTLIGEVPDPEQRRELQALFDKRETELQGV